MFLWLVYAVAFSQILILYGVATASNARLVYHLYLSKNRQWVNENPAFRQRYAAPRFAIWLSYAMGLAWLAVLLQTMAGGGPEGRLIALLVGPIFSWMALCFGYAGIEYHRVCKKIPLPARRSTSLERRTLRDFMNPFWAYLGYGLIALVAAVYVTALLRGIIAMELFAARMTGLTIAVVLQVLTLAYCIRRKKQPVDEELGPGYRRLEVIGNIPLLYLVVFIGGFRILQDLFGISLFSDITFFLFTSVLVQVTGILCATHPLVKKILAEFA